MIKRVLLLTLLGLLVYTALILRYGPSVSRTGQTTEQRNMVKAEEYLYEASARYDTVIVGSSMGDRLVADSLPKGYYNLSFGGLSAQDGLRLMEQSGHLPKLLLVEINTLDRVTESAMVRSLAHPVWGQVKRYLPFMRQKYQPFGVIKAVLRDWSMGKNKVITPEAAFHVDTAFVNKIVAGHIEGAKLTPSDSVISAALQTAYQRLEAWRQRGVRVVLFEMAADPRIEQLPITQKIRRLSLQYFPAPNYTHLKAHQAVFETTDGVHLTYDAANRFTGYIHKQIDEQVIGRKEIVSSRQ